MHHRDLECSKLQMALSETKSQYHRDKEVMKKANKQQKERTMQNERTLETVGTQLDEAVSGNSPNLTEIRFHE